MLSAECLIYSPVFDVFRHCCCCCMFLLHRRFFFVCVCTLRSCLRSQAGFHLIMRRLEHSDAALADCALLFCQLVLHHGFSPFDSRIKKQKRLVHDEFMVDLVFFPNIGRATQLMLIDNGKCFAAFNFFWRSSGLCLDCHYPLL